ncbi:PEGA domain-containing protein [Patescibacteria group bacterium]|nr:PEGA domain-containing protein [Patescibacteria group bacterium]
MNLKARKFFFYLFIAIFVLVGAYLIVSAQGLVFDYQTLDFMRTGGIFLNYTPSESQVEINGSVRDYGSTIGNLLSSGTFLNNLAPGNYNVKISYPGYSSWQKSLTVTPGVVTSASQVILWPETWSNKKISDYKTADFWLTSDGLVIKTDQNLLYFGNEKIKGTSVYLSDENRNIVITGDQNGYYAVNLDNPGSYFAIDLPKGTKIEKWFFHPFDQNAVVGTGEKYIYYVSTVNGSTGKLYSLPDNQFSYQNGNEIFVAEKSGNIFSANLVLRTNTNIETGITGGLNDLSTDAGGDELYILDNSGKLHEYDRSNGTSTVFSSSSLPFSKIYPSPDGNRLALISGTGAVTILAIKDYKMDYQVMSGDFWNVKTPGPASDFIWLPGIPNYGLILENGNLILSELDERSPQNQYEMESNISKAVLSNNNIYFIKDGSLFEVALKQK